MFEEESYNEKHNINPHEAKVTDNANNITTYNTDDVNNNKVIELNKKVNEVANNLNKKDVITAHEVIDEGIDS